MEKILPIFKDENDKILILSSLIISIFVPIIPFIILYLMRNSLSQSSLAITKGFLNFEILLFLISLICYIPFIGWFLMRSIGGFLYIINLLILLMGILSILNNKVINIPVLFKFIE